MTKHIVSFSGGKDSTAMLLMMLEREKKIDEIIFCDTGKEFPQMYDHINKVEKCINRKITRLNEPGYFDHMMFDHVKTKGKHKGKRGYGWPYPRVRWCTACLKRESFKKYVSDKYDKNYIKYIGIAFDELKRWDNNEDNRERIATPLVDWRMTEGMALKYCYDRGFDWGGLYTHFDRVSCWCCPLQNQRDLFTLYNFYPELWNQLKDMDERSWNQFKNTHSVIDLENKFNEINLLRKTSFHKKKAAAPR